MSQNEIGQSAEEASSNPEALVGQAGFIFSGTVTKLGATNMAGVPLGEETAVVRVKSFVRGPALLEAYVGKDITVKVLDPHQLSVGQDLVFFANSWVYGKSIALREVGRWAIRGDLTHLRQKIVEVEQQLADQKLERYLADAALVISGRVAQIAEVARREGSPEREHDPEWTEAVIVVEHVLARRQGSRDEGKSEVVLFAASRDIAWRRAPKLHEGQTGVWILHRIKIKELDREEYVVLDSLASWPREQLDRIKDLIPADLP
jgi:hypothetical protein